MRNIVMTLLIVIGLVPAVHAQQGKKCFFESDCTQGMTCVTPKGAMNGTCQPRSKVTVEEQKTTLLSNSIISDEGKCTFNTDCPDGGQCVKQPGTLYGTCQGSGYGIGRVNPSLVDQKRSCFFDQDCRPGQRCGKPQGSFKGMCEEDLALKDDPKDPHNVFNNQFRTSNKQCLQDGDCGIREACVTKTRSVFGVCTPKSVIEAQTTTGTTTGTSSTSLPNDPFKF